MKKSVLSIALLTAMMSIPMTMNANTMLNTPECEMYSYHHSDCATDGEVDDLIRDMNMNGLDNMKYDKAMDFLNHHCMDVDQIRRVARSFTFDAGRLKFLKSAYTHCINYRDYDRLCSVFSFSTYGEELKKYVERY